MTTHPIFAKILEPFASRPIWRAACSVCDWRVTYEGPRAREYAESWLDGTHLVTNCAGPVVVSRG